MANTIKLKKSSVAAKIPLASDLDYGELAINYTDGNLFFKDSSNTVQTISSTQFVSVTGNITGGNVNTLGNVSANYFIGDGSQLTGIAQSTALLGDGGSMGLTNHPTTSTGDAGTVTVVADVTQDLGSITVDPIPVQYVARDVDILSVVSVTGNVTVGNIFTDGYYYANGAPFAGGGGSSYTDANVATFLATGFGSNAIVTSGNITAGNFVGTVANATFADTANVAYSVDAANINGTVANATFADTANVAYSVDAANINGTVANATFADTANVAYSVDAANINGTVANATFADTASTAVTVTDAAQPNITSVGTLASLAVTGNITTGNILTDGYFYANGTALGGYGDANVVTLLASFGSNLILTSGNVSGGNISAAGLLSAAGNVTGGNIITAGIISATGNITSGNVSTTNLNLSGNVLSNVNTAANVQGGNIIANEGIYGNIYTTLIDSSDSSTITVTPELVCASDLTVQNDFYVNRIDSQDSSEILVTPAVRMESDLQVENSLTVRQDIAALSVSASGSVTAGRYFGDGGTLSNIATVVQAAGLAIALGS